MNRFAANNLKIRAIKKARELNIVGVHAEVFVFVATAGDVTFNTLMKQFGGLTLEVWVQALADLIGCGHVHQMHSSDRYYACAI